MIRVGDIIEEWEFRIEAGKIREFARAVHDVHSEDSDIAPPTFPMVVSSDFVARLVTKYFDLDRSRTVHGEQEYEYFAPIRAGDLLSCRARLVADEVKEGKRGGSMRILTNEVEYRLAATGALVCRETMVSIEKAAS